MFFIAAISAALVFGLAGCGGEEQEQAQLQETEYRMTFANQTGRDVSRLEIRLPLKATGRKFLFPKRNGKAIMKCLSR